MLVEKGASLSSPEETILHVIMRKKFRDSSKKKRFLKELSNRWQLALTRDKNEKLPLDYETDPDIRNYYQEVFKAKVKPEKEAHSRIKEKEGFSPGNSKRRQKEEEQKN